MRKLYILAMAAIAASGALTGCVQETGSDSLDPTLVCFHASIEDNGTKTSYAGSGKVDWNEGDVIRYYMSKNGTVSEYTVPQSGHKTDINVAVVPGSSFFVAAYGGEGISSNTSTSFTLTGALKAEQNGSFANAHVAACRTEDVSGATALSFYNLTSLVSFSISRTDVSYVTFTAIGGEPLHGNGTLKIDFSQNNTPSASFGSSTGNSIRIDLEGPGVYYISTLPTTLSQGFRLEYYSSSNVLLGHTDATKSQTLARNGLLKLGPLERHIESETPTGGSDSGVYLGIIGFNQMLYRYPIGILNEDSKPGFTTFVEELPSKDGTLLYYSVDEAINSLLSADFPSDLYNVSLVTFTDGLDQGSMMMTSLYESDEEYLEAIGKRIAEEKVSGFPISAYSIGLRGSDVTDVNKFRSNLKALASTDANAYEVTSMSAVNSKFQDIAENVNSSTYTYSISLKIPGPSNGTKVRFTLDNVSSATNSQKYIEGVFNLKSKTLTDVVYYGLTSTTGSTVQGTVEGIFVTFSFEGLQTSDNSFIQQGNIKQWNYVTSTSSWQVNSEFSPAQNSTIGHSKRSAVVMLLLDCSSSLGSKFSTMQQGAKSFISTLTDAAEDKYSVASVTLDKTELTLLLGGSATLNATILPTTALEKGIIWTSSDENVVTVDQNGKVTAVGYGKASITVTTVDGAKTASCEVAVNQLVESITLDITELEIYVGDDPTSLTATVVPDEYVNKSFTWTSSNASVATVDSDGNVKAVSNGNATIIVKTNDGSGLSASCNVTVYRHVESVSLNKTELSLFVGRIATLTATVLPIDASEKSVYWSSDNSSIASVDQTGNVTAVGMGSAIITVTTVDLRYTASCSVSVLETINGYEYVDLGLPSGLKWSTCDLGATKPEEAGRFFMWGETESGSYSWYSYKWCKESNHWLIKYCTDSSYWDGYDTMDNKTILDLNDDAAHACWGGSWRMPTESEWAELINNCTWSWTYNYNGIGVAGGYIVSSSNGNSIFLPSGGFRSGQNLYEDTYGAYYWSSSLYADCPEDAWCFHNSTTMTRTWRVDGLRVRPVSEYPVKYRPVESLSLNKTELSIYVTRSATLIATVLPDKATDKSVTWSSSDNSIASVDKNGKVTAVGPGSTTIMVTTVDGGHQASCSVIVKAMPELTELGKTFEAIDLGLSVKWASFNLGATKPHEFGDYFAWGETEPKSEYSNSTYKWSNSSYNSGATYKSFTKYCPLYKGIWWGGSGWPDDKIELDPEDDAAIFVLGGGWRMPTDAEWEELKNNCSLSWNDSYNGTGIAGIVVIAGNGNSIFLPAAGYRSFTNLYSTGSGFYNSSSLDATNPQSMLSRFFSGGYFSGGSSSSRSSGYSIRPVSK